MLFQAIVIAASAAFASAQVVYNSTTGQFVCPANAPNGDFCAGDSLSTNIIIRCNNGIGQPGNCNDNLSGYPPLGVNFAQCWQSSPTSGNAACAKNCLVECSSGGCGNGTITLPNCTPISSSTSSASASSATSSSVPVSSSTTSTGTTTITSQGTTITNTFTTTVPCPPTTLSSIISTGTGAPAPPSNGTVSVTSVIPGSPTKTPVGPTTSAPSSPAFTGAANTFRPAVGGTLAGVGLIMAYFF